MPREQKKSMNEPSVLFSVYILLRFIGQIEFIINEFY